MKGREGGSGEEGKKEGRECQNPGRRREKEENKKGGEEGNRKTENRRIVY